MPWRLLVIDGADAERYFPLPESGTRAIGNSHKHADFHLNDLYVGRVHCEIECDGERIVARALEESKDTLVNGQKIVEAELRAGDVLRVGNSHLRLEPVSDEPVEDGFEAVEEDVEEVLAVDADADAKEVVPHHAAELPYLEWDELDGLTGHHLGHFQVGEMLGRGFHGAVFRANDQESHHEVALKVIGPEFPANAQELQRFARVIKEIASIHEDHLVRWFAAGKTGPYCWISQELIEGDSLAHILQKEEPTSKVTWRNAIKLAIDLAKALDCLYKRRIIHGNLVPANVLIRVTDRMVKLNDLMFTEALMGSEWFKDRLEGKLLAELPYLPPERVEPGAYWDSLADIYSLGALVYARLTNRPPCQGGTPGETIELIRTGKIVAPKKIVKDLPDAFQSVLLKMLANRQEDRYQTPDALLRDLNTVHAIG